MDFGIERKGHIYFETLQTLENLFCCSQACFFRLKKEIVDFLLVKYNIDFSDSRVDYYKELGSLGGLPSHFIVTGLDRDEIIVDLFIGSSGVMQLIVVIPLKFCDPNCVVELGRKEVFMNWRKIFKTVYGLMNVPLFTNLGGFFFNQASYHSTVELLRNLGYYTDEEIVDMFELKDPKILKVSYTDKMRYQLPFNPDDEE